MDRQTKRWNDTQRKKKHWEREKERGKRERIVPMVSEFCCLYRFTQHIFLIQKKESETEANRRSRAREKTPFRPAEESADLTPISYQSIRQYPFIPSFCTALKKHIDSSVATKGTERHRGVSVYWLPLRSFQLTITSINRLLVAWQLVCTSLKSETRQR